MLSACSQNMKGENLDSQEQHCCPVMSKSVCPMAWRLGRCCGLSRVSDLMPQNYFFPEENFLSSCGRDSSGHVIRPQRFSTSKYTATLPVCDCQLDITNTMKQVKSEAVLGQLQSKVHPLVSHPWGVMFSKFSKWFSRRVVTSLNHKMADLP